MRLQVIHPAPPASVIGDSGTQQRRNPSHKNQDGPKIANTKGVTPFDATREGLPVSSSRLLLREDTLLQCIKDGLANELECLVDLSTAVANKDGHDDFVDAIHLTAAALESTTRKTARKPSKEEKAADGGCKESETKTITNPTTSNDNKENNATNLQPRKLLVRLPSVDWKTALSTAKAADAIGETTLETEAIGESVSGIVHGWLIVLAKLNDLESPVLEHREAGTDPNHESANGSCASKASQGLIVSTQSARAEAPGTASSACSSPLSSFPVFFAVASYRSQIHRRLTLLLQGFVETIGPSLMSGRDHASTHQEAMALSVVKHTRDLARKILKEEGSSMKKSKKNKKRSFSFDPIPFSESGTETADGVYYYCWFTAVAAECGEYLGDQDTALLAYKSIRAMQDRQKQHGAAASAKDGNLVGVYACGVDPIGEGTGNQTMAPTLSKSFTNAFHDSSSSSYSCPRISVTKTPANTPKATARKRNPRGSDTVGNSRSAVATMNHNDSSNHHPLGIRRSKTAAMCSSVSSIGGLRVSPVAPLSGVPLRNASRCGPDSKIGNALVPPGTLEERLRRCS